MKPGISQVKEYPCMICNKRFGKPANGKLGHSHKELMRCMSSMSFKYMQIVDEIKAFKELNELKKKGSTKEEKSDEANSDVSLSAKEFMKALKEKGDIKRNVNVEKNTKLSEKEQDSSLDVETGKNIKKS